MTHQGQEVETAQNKRASGLKARIQHVLDQQAAGRGLTISQIGAALGVAKDAHGEITACLNKLKGQGRAKSTTGPASSALGRRFVKHWVAVKQKTPQVIVVKEDDARRALSFTR